MRTPLLFAAALQVTAPAPQPMPAQPASTGEAAQPSPPSDPAQLSPEAQFARYDANGDGVLDKSEYGVWLIALRAAQEADFKGDTRDVKAWIDGSFTGTDVDRDGKVSREELIRFLTPVAG